MDKHAFHYEGLTITRDWEAKELELFARGRGEEICVTLDAYNIQNLNEALEANDLYRHGEDVDTQITLFPIRNHLGGRTLQVGEYFVFLPHEIVNSLRGLTKATRNLGWKIPLQGVTSCYKNP